MLGFAPTIFSTRIDGACVTLLNSGNGVIGISMNGTVSTSDNIAGGATRTLCGERLFFVGVTCEGPGTCTFEWRIDRAAVSTE